MNVSLSRRCLRRSLLCSQRGDSLVSTDLSGVARLLVGCDTHLEVPSRQLVDVAEKNHGFVEVTEAMEQSRLSRRIVNTL